MENLLNWEEAAVYCGVPTDYLRSMVGHRTGPRCIKPSTRKTFFKRADLENWMRRWKVLPDGTVEREPLGQYILAPFAHDVVI